MPCGPRWWGPGNPLIIVNVSVKALFQRVVPRPESAPPADHLKLEHCHCVQIRPIHVETFALACFDHDSRSQALSQQTKPPRREGKMTAAETSVDPVANIGLKRRLRLPTTAYESESDHADAEKRQGLRFGTFVDDRPRAARIDAAGVAWGASSATDDIGPETLTLVVCREIPDVQEGIE